VTAEAQCRPVNSVGERPGLALHPLPNRWCDWRRRRGECALAAAFGEFRCFAEQPIEGTSKAVEDAEPQQDCDRPPARCERQSIAHMRPAAGRRPDLDRRRQMAQGAGCEAAFMCEVLAGNPLRHPLFPAERQAKAACRADPADAAVRLWHIRHGIARQADGLVEPGRVGENRPQHRGRGGELSVPVALDHSHTHIPDPRCTGHCTGLSRLMPPKRNPLQLNALQLRTLTLLQELARLIDYSQPGEEPGSIVVRAPEPHGDHFHLGESVVAFRDASGLRNPAVWVALERKGLLRSMYPYGGVLTPLGLDYETGMREMILHKTGH
jgi:hypothetical protein